MSTRQTASNSAAFAAKLFRFAGAGIAVTLTYVGVAWLVAEITAAAPLAASLWGYAAAVAISYPTQKYFTFRSTGAHRVELPRYAVICVVAFLGSVGSMAAVTVVGWDYRVGLAVAVVAVPALNFTAMNVWAFRRQRPRGGHEARATGTP